MKSLVFYCVALFALCAFGGCGRKAHVFNESGSPPYETMYKDSFDVLLHSMQPPYTQIDSLYTEMYIALKSMRYDKTNFCAKMVCIKVDELVRLDSSKMNQIDYLEAKQIAQRVLEDQQGFIATAFRMYNLYPEECFERLGSLGSLYLAINNKDSAEFYLNKCMDVSLRYLNSEDYEIKKKSILGILHSLVLLGKDKEAKEFLHNQLLQNPSGQIAEFVRAINDNFDNFKQSEWNSVRNFSF